MPTTTTTSGAMAGYIYCDSTLLTPFGRTYTESNVEISRGERTASGKLVRDVIATKKRFELSYSHIDGDELAKIEALYAEGGEHVLLVYYDDEDMEWYTVLMNPIDKTRVLLLGDGLWGNVKVEFEEV